MGLVSDVRLAGFAAFAFELNPPPPPTPLLTATPRESTTEEALA